MRELMAKLFCKLSVLLHQIKYFTTYQATCYEPSAPQNELDPLLTYIALLDRERSYDDKASTPRCPAVLSLSAAIPCA
jgi:hypothetical protein